MKKILLGLFVTVLAISSTYVAYSLPKTNTQVQFVGKDGFNLTGTVNVPKNATIKNKVPMVIFLHSLGRTKESWKTFPTDLENINVATFNIDMRGHGQSILTKGQKKSYWQNYTTAIFSKYPSDIADAVKYVKDNYPEVDANKIAIVASNISANAAVVAAGNKSISPKTLILLSPTTTYKGLSSTTPLVNYGAKPVLIIVSKSDKFTYSECSSLIKYAQGVKKLEVFPTGGNGEDLLFFQPKSKTIIIDWLKNYLIK